MSYPRRQTLVIFAVCAVALIVVALYKYRTASSAPSAASAEENVVVSAAPTTTPALSDDTDWKKAFEQGGSASSGAFNTGSSADSNSDASLTPLDVLGRNFLTQYATLKQNGLTQDPATVDDVMSQVASQSIAGMATPKVYASADIQTIPTSPAATRQYGKDINAIFARDLPSQNEAILAQKAFDDNEMSELTAIDPVINGYQAMLNDLLALPVPQPLATDHLALINGVSIALYNAQSFRHMDTDPVRGMAAVSLELAGLQGMSSALTNIQDYFVSSGIAFGS